jgi:hypothetical protein
MLPAFTLAKQVEARMIKDQTWMYKLQQHYVLYHIFRGNCLMLETFLKPNIHNILVGTSIAAYM